MFKDRGIQKATNNGYIQEAQEGMHTTMQVGQSWNSDISNKSNGEIKYYLTMYSTKGDLDNKIKELETEKYVLEESNDNVMLNYMEVMQTGSIINMNINKRVDENIVNKIIY